jgi:hypothetical protein
MNSAEIQARQLADKATTLAELKQYVENFEGCELKQFARDTGATVLWQNLFQPEYLDPFLHGPAVAQLAAEEIRQFYKMNTATDAERQFFDQALSKYDSIVAAQPGIVEKFKKHIHDIETQYHPDTQGQFYQLWPELAESIT